MALARIIPNATTTIIALRYDGPMFGPLGGVRDYSTLDHELLVKVDADTLLQLYQALREHYEDV